MALRISEDDMYMSIAHVISKRSCATRNKVGAILVKDRQVIAEGYNGMPPGFSNDEIEFINENGELVTNPIVFHAESNAITNCAKSTNSSSYSTLYVTVSPCLDCAKLIIQAGIVKVFYKDSYRNTEGLDLLKRANIEVVKLNSVVLQPILILN